MSKKPKKKNRAEVGEVEANHDNNGEAAPPRTHVILSRPGRLLVLVNPKKGEIRRREKSGYEEVNRTDNPNDLIPMVEQALHAVPLKKKKVKG